MKKFILFFLFSGSLMLVSFVWNADDPTVETAIHFTEGSWDSILKTAKEQNKIIFVDIYATWCGPCKMLKRNTFTDAEVGKYFNENFINVSLDGEKGDGKKLARQLEIHAYPTMFFINPDGSIKSEVVGYRNAKQLLREGKEVTGK